MIQVTNLVKTFGERKALSGITFHISKGDICGYIGPNGAGKSTTVKILSGMLEPDEGEVIVNGVDVCENPDAVKPFLGYVPETGAVYEALTPREYLMLVGRLYGMKDNVVRERTDVMLKFFDLQDDANEVMSGFSKGMKQKVVILSALLHDPALFFFDEPLHGLDARSTVLFKELLFILARQGKTILYCSHLLDIVERVCTRLLVLRNGKIVAEGTIDELRELTNKDTLEDAFSILTESTDLRARAETLIKDLAELPVSI